MTSTLTRPILVVEDSDEDFEIARIVLGEAGVSHPLLRCSTGQEVLDYIEGQGQSARHFRPALILMDLNLPGIDGSQLLSLLRQKERFRSVPIVVLSTSASPVDVDLCYRLGANSYLVKPIELNRFENMMRSFCNYWFEIVCLPGQGG